MMIGAGCAAEAVPVEGFVKKNGVTHFTMCFYTQITKEGAVPAAHSSAYRCENGVSNER